MATMVALGTRLPLHVSSDSESNKGKRETRHGEVIEFLTKAGVNVKIPSPKGKLVTELVKTHYGEPTSGTIRMHEHAIQALQ